MTDVQPCRLGGVAWSLACARVAQAWQGSEPAVMESCEACDGLPLYLHELLTELSPAHITSAIALSRLISSSLYSQRTRTLSRHRAIQAY
jgi:hypothetical protein